MGCDHVADVAWMATFQRASPQEMMDSPVEHQTLALPVVEYMLSEEEEALCMGFQRLFNDSCTEGVQGQQRAPNRGGSRVFNQSGVGGLLQLEGQ